MDYIVDVSNTIGLAKLSAYLLISITSTCYYITQIHVLKCFPHLQTRLPTYLSIDIQSEAVR